MPKTNYYLVLTRDVREERVQTVTLFTSEKKAQREYDRNRALGFETTIETVYTEVPLRLKDCIWFVGTKTWMEVKE
jgi:hypothetical protein